IQGRQLLFGNLLAGSSVHRHFLAEEVGFAQAVADVLSLAIERTQAEAALAASEERFRRLAEHAPDFIYRYEVLPQPHYAYANPASTQLTGYTPAEYYADPELGYSLVHPEDRGAFDAIIQTLVQGQPIAGPIPFRLRHKDGHVVWTES